MSGTHPTDEGRAEGFICDVCRQRVQSVTSDALASVCDPCLRRHRAAQPTREQPPGHVLTISGDPDDGGIWLDCNACSSSTPVPDKITPAELQALADTYDHRTDQQMLDDGWERIPTDDPTYDPKYAAWRRRSTMSADAQRHERE